MAECIDAVKKIEKIDRHACREHIVNNFSVKQMTNGYEAVYQQILTGRFERTNPY